MSVDQLNAGFEFGGALLLLLDVMRLRRDRLVLGVHWGPRAFFTAWGLWNLFYYNQLDQRWSLLAGAFLALVNCWWLLLLARYQSQRTIDDFVHLPPFLR